MVKQVESYIADKCLDYIKKLNLFYDHRSGSGGFNYRKGIPDTYIVVNGIHVECELKTPFGSRSPLQEKWATRFKEWNIPYICPRSFEEFKEFIDKLLGSSKFDF